MSVTIPRSLRARALAMMLVVSAPALVSGGTSVASLPRRPNLILIVADDLRAEDMRYLPQTRRLLAGHGVTFTNAFASTPLCCPSRASMLTGQYSHNHGVHDNVPPQGGVGAFDDSSTIATWLQDAGYTTGLVGKYLNGYEFLPASFVPPGWDSWAALATGTKAPVYYNYVLDEDGVLRTYGSRPRHYLTDVLSRRATRFIRSAAGPFFLAFQPYAPHAPAVPAPGDDPPGLFLPRTASFNEEDVADKPWGDQMPVMSPATIRGMRTYYRDAVATLRSLDRAVAAIVGALRERDELDRTVIAFTSDNGFMLGEHRIQGKTWPYEASIRVPLVFRLPGATKARTERRFASNVDIVSTLAELAGVAPRLEQDGLSLLPLLEGRSVSWRSGVYLEFRGTPGPQKPVPYKAFRTERHKLVIYDDGTRELYDLLTDPDELTNLADDPALDGVERRLESMIRRSGGS